LNHQTSPNEKNANINNNHNFQDGETVNINLINRFSNPIASLEDISSNSFKPMIKEFVPLSPNQNSIPFISFHPEFPTLSPFVHPEEAEEAWKRRNNYKKQKIDPSAKFQRNGWCECCRMRFSRLDTHLTSSKHIEFVSSPEKYDQIDLLLESINVSNVSSPLNSNSNSASNSESPQQVENFHLPDQIQEHIFQLFQDDTNNLFFEN